MKAAILFGLPAACAFGQGGQVGSMAASWSGLTDLAGKTITLEEQRGKVVLISLIMISCGGCRGNAAAVGATAHKYTGRPFQAL